MIEIKLQPSNFYYTFSQILEDIEYIFSIRWNARDSAWYMSLSDTKGNVIEKGIKLMLGSALRYFTANPDYVRGIFSLADLSGEDKEATFDDLGVRCILVFIPNDEL